MIGKLVVRAVSIRRTVIILSIQRAYSALEIRLYILMLSGFIHLPMAWILASVAPHMRSDGDGFVAAATGEVEAPVDQVRMLAVVAVETAIRSTVGSLEG